MVRRLSAIMFTDMVGYTSLMQESERRAKAQRDRQRAVLDRVVPEHGGEVLQYYGDGTLSVYPSAVEAVRAAIAIQHGVMKETPVPMRIGIHIGDVVLDEHGVLGDGVNIAARVQSLAIPGSVLITSKVADELSNHPELTVRSLGQVALKGVRGGMEVFALTGEGLDVPAESQLAGARPQELHSVAVLPFTNMSSDPENEFFADGITEEIINALTRVEGVQVTARTSSFAFKGKNLDVREIAGKLGVTTILEGSVRRFGSRVRITAQLIDARDGYHLFSEVYDRSLDDIFATQDEISIEIVRRLEERLGPVRKSGSAPSPAQDSLVLSHTHDTEAYTEYLKGKFRWNQWTPQDANAAIVHFERSAEMDPTCSLPFSAMAQVFTFLASIGHLPAEDAYPRAAAHARHALELEPDAGEVHLALGGVKLFYDWDFEGARVSLEKAIARIPGSAEARHIYSLYLKAVGRLDDAVREMEVAVRLDPLSLPLNFALGVACLSAGRLEAAEAQIGRTLELDPTFRAAVEAAGFLRIHRDDPEGALEIWRTLPALSGDRFVGASHMGFALARLGRTAEAHEMLELLNERGREHPGLNLRMDYALLYWGLNDLDQVFHHLGAAIEERMGVVIFLATSPNWKPLRSDPRFQALVDRVGIPVREPIFSA